ncbi:MAG: ABC transporter ATP-binding protein [Tannerella sp.]|jgi:ABC-type lipoprotein export system ATPase subunit|nr:ABC transporter ATP-binding protein [Tannerella sp.]
MIQLKDIEKSYPDGSERNQVLRGVNLTVGRGEFVAVTGESGSGKTTLLNILGLLVKPDSGTYLLDGEDVSVVVGDAFRDKNDKAAGLRNRKIGFVFQEHRLLPQYTLYQNILLPTIATPSKVTKEQTEYANLLMDMTEIAPLANHYPSNVSGGEAGRAALCRALIMKPLLLLADEPTGQLDSRNAQNIISLLKKINGELGTTVLMVSHSKETVVEAERILNLKEGLLS